MEERGKSICVLKKEECCGCGACYNRCPQNAIEMVMDEEGFLYPKVDFTKCNNCGLCQKMCPSISANYSNNKQPKVYAAWAADSIRKKSSSGGMFTLLAEWILSQGGLVCGAALDEDIKVQHILIDNKHDLEKLRGSKYVMSDTKKVYSEILGKLKEGRKVLFCGCPCQVAGMLTFLGKEYENLYTVDLLCAGGTSQGLFEKYKKEVHGKYEIKNIDFRNKKWFGWPASMVVEYKNGKIYKRARKDDIFYRYFLNNLAKRPFCETCKFSKLPRQGDLTLGDFWGIEKYKKGLDDGIGTSVVTINTEKGNGLFAQIESSIKMLEEIPLKFLLERGQPFQKYKRSNKNRRIFLKLAQEYSIEMACDYVMNDKFDASKCDVWKGSSYGSVLAYCSLYHVLNEQGTYSGMLERPGYNIEQILFSSFFDMSHCERDNRPLTPFFLPERSMFDTFIEKSRKREEKSFLAAYIVEPTPEKKEAVLYVAKELGLEPKILLDGTKSKFVDNKKKMELDEYVLNNIDVEEWLYYIGNCDYFITDSSYGTNFAVLYERQFVYIKNETGDILGMESLLKKFNLEERLVRSAEEIIKNNNTLSPIDYTVVYEKLQKERQYSLEWLHEVLKSKGKNAPKIAYKVLINRWKCTAIKVYKKIVRPHISEKMDKKIQSYMR